MRRSMISATAACALAASATGLEAATSAGNFYEDSTSKSCSNSYSCRLDWAVTPSDKFLTIRFFNCYIDSNLPLRIVAFGVTQSQGGFTSRSIYIPFQVNTTGNGIYYYSINEEMAYKIGRGKYLLASVETSSPGNKSIWCSFSGELSDT